MSDIKEFFEEHGYCHAKAVFDPTEVAALERDFDGIVRQLTANGEAIDATWDGGETDKIGRKDDVILHTHNVQKYSRTWLNAFLNPRFLDVAGAILGQDTSCTIPSCSRNPQRTARPSRCIRIGPISRR